MRTGTSFTIYYTICVGRSVREDPVLPAPSRWRPEWYQAAYTWMVEN